MAQRSGDSAGDETPLASRITWYALSQRFASFCYAHILLRTHSRMQQRPECLQLPAASQHCNTRHPMPFV